MENARNGNFNPDFLRLWYFSNLELEHAVTGHRFLLAHLPRRIYAGDRHTVLKLLSLRRLSPIGKGIRKG